MVYTDSIWNKEEEDELKELNVKVKVKEKEKKLEVKLEERQEVRQEVRQEERQEERKTKVNKQKIFSIYLISLVNIK